MKQINKSVIASMDNDREPSWCIFYDTKNRCDTTDFGDSDCGSCDFGTECK